MPPVSNTERLRKEIYSPVINCITDKKGLLDPIPKQVEDADLLRNSLKTLREKIPLKGKEVISSPLELESKGSPLEPEKRDSPLESIESYKTSLLKLVEEKKEIKKQKTSAGESSKVKTSESSKTKAVVSINKELQTLKISFAKEFVHKEEHFPGLSEENKRIFEDDYSQISQLVYCRNTNYVSSGYLVDFRGQYPKIIIHKAEKLSMNIIKSLYDLGYISRLYVKDVKVLGLLPKPIRDAVTKFRSIIINDDQVTCIKIWKTSPKYSATGGELVEISPARHFSTKFKDGGGRIPNFDAEFFAKRRAFTIIEYWEALEKRVLVGKGWTYHVSEKLVVLCKRDKPFQEVELKQLSAYARKIPLLQVAASPQMRRHLCDFFQTKKSSHKCNYCKSKEEKQPTG